MSSSSTTDEYVGEESKGHDDEEAYANRHEHLPEHRLERLEHRPELLGAVVDDGDESLGDDDECVGHHRHPDDDDRQHVQQRDHDSLPHHPVAKWEEMSTAGAALRQGSRTL